MTRRRSEPRGGTGVPLPAVAKPPATPSPAIANFAKNTARLNLSVDSIVGIHGGVAPIAELNRALGK